jgi:hypothetical protein
MDQVSEPLFCSVYGQVKYCCYSGDFGIDFGAMQLWTCQERLRQLARKVNQLVRYSGPLHKLAVSHQFEISPPGYEGEFFSFYADELLDLQMLMNGALAMVDLYQFLSAHQFQLETSSFQ